MFEQFDIYNEIPGVPSCHCSSLIWLPNGKLFCAFFAGQYEKAPDVAIWGSEAGFIKHLGTMDIPANSDQNSESIHGKSCLVFNTER